MVNDNFKWLVTDIDSTLVLKVFSSKDTFKDNYLVFNLFDVLETTGEKLEVVTANIDDLTNLLTIGIVRFVNVANTNDVLDIPFRNLYLLYKFGNKLESTSSLMSISLNELEAFTVIDGKVNNDFLLSPILISDISDDLKKVMKIAHEFMNYGMQEKFDAMSRITLINHQRLKNDKNNITLK